MAVSVVRYTGDGLCWRPGGQGSVSERPGAHSYESRWVADGRWCRLCRQALRRRGRCASRGLSVDPCCGWRCPSALSLLVPSGRRLDRARPLRDRRAAACNPVPGQASAAPGLGPWRWAARGGQDCLLRPGRQLAGHDRRTRGNCHAADWPGPDAGPVRHAAGHQQECRTSARHGTWRKDRSWRCADDAVGDFESHCPRSGPKIEG
jgi:hypothetical protein